MTGSETKPKWLRRRLPAAGHRATVLSAIKRGALNTVCEEAHCPNQMDCYGAGTATLLLLGPGCTRRCTFCAVDKSFVSPPDSKEPEQVAGAIAQLNLNYAVLTMVTRDDLPDGGAEHVAQTILTTREKCPEILLEVLISDLQGDWKALQTVLEASPEVLNHNLETVPRLYPQVRPQAEYGRSLMLLNRASRFRPPTVTKSGLMLGLGEHKDEILQVMDDLRDCGCQLLTLGQYLAPSKIHHPVVRYVPPEEFETYKDEALARGFYGVASAPFVRSSFQADSLYRVARHQVPQL